MNGKDYLTVSQLKYTRSCGEYKDLAVMHLGGAAVPEFERNEAIKNALIESLMAESESAAKDTIRGFFAEKYAILPGVLNKDAGSMTLLKAERFIGWFYNQGFKLRASNLKYCFPLDGILVKGVSDMLIQRTDGSSLYMDIRFGKNPYSDAARKAENKTENSIELLARMCTASFENRDCAIAYLTAKRDKSRELTSDIFENGKGTNLAYMAVRADAKEKLKEMLNVECKKDCNACRMNELCNTKPFVEEDYIVKEVKKSVSTMSKPTLAQSVVINHEDGPMVCTAIPGAGKTRVLVERMFRMIKEGKNPKKFFFATFTRKACREIKDRIEKIVKKGNEPTIGTFHSIAYDIIKESTPDAVNRIATETVKYTLIEEALKHCPIVAGFSYDYPALDNGLYKGLMAQFENIKKVGEDAYTFEKGDREAVIKAYHEYTKLYEAGMYFEYDDMISKAVDILKNKDVLEMYRDLWDYYMVDEFQDVSKDQAEFIMLLAGRNNNLLVVGDDDQAIYEWRNGTDFYLRHFDKFYPDAKLVYMEDNFRTTAKILDSAESLISNNKERYGKHINSVKEEGLPPYYAEGIEDSGFIELLKNEKGFEPQDICILGRNNSELSSLALKMEDAGLHSIGPRNYIINSKEFGLLKCFLNFAKLGTLTPGQDLYRVLRYCDIKTEKTYAAIYEQFFDEKLMPAQISCALVALKQPEKELNDILKDVFTELTGIDVTTAALDALLDRLEEEGLATWEEALKLMHDMERFRDTSEIEYPRREGYYNILTSHKAKGKEFPCVYIYGVENYSDTKEDRNLLYVSMTRAEKKLVMIQRGLQLAPLIDEVKGLKALEIGDVI